MSVVRACAWSILGLTFAALQLAIVPATTAAPLEVRPFALTDQDGRSVTARSMQGRPYLVSFGFTHCADVDVATLSEVSAIMRNLGPDADRVGALFITVDPQRDTPAAMKRYLSEFDPHVRGLTGNATAVNAMMKAFHIHHHKVAFKGGYGVDHTTTVYLVNKNGKFVGPFDIRRPPHEGAADLRQFM